MNDLGTISPCTKPAILCDEFLIVVFVEFDMAALVSKNTLGEPEIDTCAAIDDVWEIAG
jgi:hypothetical protein